MLATCLMPLLSGPSFLGPWVQEKRWVYTWAEVGTGAHLDDVSIGAALVRLVVLGVLEQHLVHVGAGVLEQLVGVVEDDEGNLAVAQHAQLIGLLHQPKLPLGEGHLAVPFISDSLDLNLFPPHLLRGVLSAREEGAAGW